ncbi:MAG: Hsp20/alpha crystallin family protein [Thermodesulfovibrionales bacterium]
MTVKDLIPFGRRSVPLKREDESPFAVLRREMDELFDSFFRGFETEAFERGSLFSPHVDVLETDEAIKVTAELPGMDEKDVEVSLDNDTLTIKGEKKEEKEDRSKGFYRMERHYGSFQRVIPIPREVETDKVEATFKKGVLTVKLPKTAKAVKETRKISVKAD